MATRAWTAAVLCALLGAGSAFPFERFVNYASLLTVNGFAFDNDVVWAATSGGLYEYNRPTRRGTLYSSAEFYPDPALTSLCFDAKRNLWTCSQNGYLTCRPLRGTPSVFTPYHAAGWNLTCCVPYGRYLIIGSNRGCSVFDTEKRLVLKNAGSFGGSSADPQVNAIAVFNDTLVLGRQRGIAKLYIGGNRLAEANFYDPSIWTLDSLDGRPVLSLVPRPGAGVQAFGVPAVRYGGGVLSARSTGSSDTSHGILYADSLEKIRLPSIVTALAAAPGGFCCIGTTLDYFYFWDGADTVHVAIDGPTFSRVLRVYADREGCAWVCPSITAVFTPANPWWEGISVFRNGAWQLYSPAKYPSMGIMTGAVVFKGVVEDQFGRMWFGTPGGQIKRYDRAANAWLKYCVGAQSYGRGLFFQSANCFPPDWAKCDAVARDSSGFLWAGLYYGFLGCILCYDPRYEPDPYPPDAVSRHFRYFFPQGDPSYSDDITSICVDAHNNIFIGSDDGKITVFTHNGNPLRDSVSVSAAFTGQGSLFDAAATADGLTYLATGNGFRTYDPAAKKPVDGLCTRSWTNGTPITTVVQPASALRNISAVEVQDERILWLGTLDSGLIRYDLSNNTRSVFDETRGLLSNQVNDLSVNRSKGELWIATNRGVSRFSLGYSLEGGTGGAVLICPNPFSKRRHRDLAFDNLPSGSTTCIYTVSGTLVASLPPAENGVHGSFCVWKPPSSIVPGVYLCVVRSSGANRLGRVIVTP